MSRPRLANAILGAWLFISAFIWYHAPAQFTNTWLLGMIIFALALSARAFDWARYVTAAAAVWLFFSTLLLPRANAGTVWHNCLLAIVVFAVALMPGRFARRFQPAGRRA